MEKMYADKLGRTVSGAGTHATTIAIFPAGRRGSSAGACRTVVTLVLLLSALATSVVVTCLVAIAALHILGWASCFPGPVTRVAAVDTGTVSSRAPSWGVLAVTGLA